MSMAASSSGKRQISVRLGALAYAGKALPGTRLSFDAEWGAWSVTVLPRGRWDFLRSASAVWRHPWITVCGGVFMLLGAGLVSWALLLALGDPGEGASGSTAYSGGVRSGAVEGPSWVASVAAPAGLAGALRPSPEVSPAVEVGVEVERPSPAEPSRSQRRARMPGPKSRQSVLPVERDGPAGASGIREFTVPASPPTGDTLLAVLDDTTIMVPNPLGVPTPVRIGQRLPSGATLLQVDPAGQFAVTDRGAMVLE